MARGRQRGAHQVTASRDGPGPHGGCAEGAVSLPELRWRPPEPGSEAAGAV